MKITIICISILCSLHSLSLNSAPRPKQKFVDDDSLPDFTVKNVKGEDFQLSNLKGKYIMLDFWASWCRPCIASLPRVDSLHSKYSGKNFAIVSISIDKNRTAWLREQSKHHIRWINTISVDAKITQYFHVDAVPHTVLIDPNGDILLTEEGLVKDSSIELKLQEIFKN